MYLRSVLTEFQVAIDYSVMTLDYNPKTDDACLLDTLKTLEEFWYLGMETEPEWRQAVRSNVPALFTLMATANDFHNVDTVVNGPGRRGGVRGSSTNTLAPATTSAVICSSSSVIYR